MEVKHKCVEQRKRRDNASIPDTNDGKDERAKIIAEERDNRRVEYLEHHIQNFKSKAYYRASNDQRSINIHQEKVDILEEMMDAEREEGRKKMHCMEDELDKKRKKSA